MFDPERSDLSGMADPALSGPLSIARVVHKTFLNLDEAGTEAAGATGVVIGTTSVPVGDEVTLTVDRPFAYLIRDKTTGVVLFLGQLADPRS